MRSHRMFNNHKLELDRILEIDVPSLPDYFTQFSISDIRPLLSSALKNTTKSSILQTTPINYFLDKPIKEIVVENDKLAVVFETGIRIYFFIVPYRVVIDKQTMTFGDTISLRYCNVVAPEVQVQQPSNLETAVELRPTPVKSIRNLQRGATKRLIGGD
jgi:hypothetical protein